jgi:hypothetical protein
MNRSKQGGMGKKVVVLLASSSGFGPFAEAQRQQNT